MRNREAKAERGPADKRQRSTGQLALGQFFSVEIQASGDVPEPAEIVM
jgi:hypothetical protein